MTDKRILKNLTKTYLSKGSDVDDYIENLLPIEWYYLIDQERIKVEPTEVLVQLVGYSWEPLFISICAYQPDIVVPILNEYYGEQEGKARGYEFKENITKLKNKKLINNEPKFCPKECITVKETPQDVFKFLKRYVLPFINSGKKVVVDITGAKKSMVSGAYLFSSYAKTMVSYVNFEIYDKKFGKPYGYTCKLDRLENPFEIFKLNEWDRVQHLYEQYAFRSAIDLIEEIKDGTESYFENDELKSILVLEKWLEFYRLWDEGDYNGSLGMFKEIGSENSHCPNAVEKLGSGLWKNRTDFRGLISNFEDIEGLSDINDSIYLKDEEILVYAHDELGKIKRLIKYNEDFRSALLRAAGLNDILLKARFVRLWVNNQITIEKNGSIFDSRESINEHDSVLTEELDKEILGRSGTTSLINFLLGKGKYIKVGEIKLHLLDNVPRLKKFWKKLNFDKFNIHEVFKLRNKAIHFCLSIPENTAKEATFIAEGNLKDFQNSHENLIIYTPSNWIYEAMSWNELCEVCGITFLPKQLEEQK